MRAGHITHEGPAEEAIKIVTVDTPEPDPGEVRIRVEACGLNRLDVFARVGYPEEDDDFPKRTGGDIVGTIDAVGKNVPEERLSDEVMVYGGFTCGNCEYCLSVAAFPSSQHSTLDDVSDLNNVVSRVLFMKS